MSVYCIDHLSGNDSNSGLGIDKAWQTLQPANSRTFMPGDQLLLHRGGQWEGMLHPKGEGAPGKPIVLGAYGEGPLPIINGMGAEAAVKLSGQSHILIREIHAQNRAEERAVRHGIMLYGAAGRITENITVERCEVSHVTGENRRALPKYKSMYWNGGIYAGMPGRSSETAHFSNLLIQDNHIHDVLTSGIRIAQQEDFVIDIYHQSVTVRRNLIERTGTDGIIVANCVSPLIEGNTCYDAGALGTLEDTRLIAGIWVCSVSDAVIRKNEVARTRLFENDGTAFDTDWGVSGTILFEENYSHENHGGFFLDCGGLNKNPGYVKTVLRGNISINDHRCVVQDSHSPRVELCGNLFYQDRESVDICLHTDGSTHYYKDNVFFYTQAPSSGWKQAELSKNRWIQTFSSPPKPKDGFDQIKVWVDWGKAEV